jgi:hypothetical protein
MKNRAYFLNTDFTDNAAPAPAGPLRVDNPAFSWCPSCQAFGEPDAKACDLCGCGVVVRPTYVETDGKTTTVGWEANISPDDPRRNMVVVNFEKPNGE